MLQACLSSMAETKDAPVEQTSVLLDLKTQIKTAKINLPELSTIAKKGNERLVEKFLTESVEVRGNPSEVLQSQLYIASFWGFPDVVTALLQDESVDVNHQNRDTLWTPLHAAAFQEHGKVVMILLERGAKPDLPDAEGRTAADFASASDKIWAHFAALGCLRTSKQDMVEKDIIKKVTAPVPSETNSRPSSSSKANMRMAAYSRPDSAYVVRPDAGFSKKAANDSSQMSAVLGGDILAGEDETNHSTNTSQQPNFSLWRT